MTYRAISPAETPKGHMRRLTRRYMRWPNDITLAEAGRCPACNKPWDDHPTKTCSRHLVNR